MNFTQSHLRYLKCSELSPCTLLFSSTFSLLLRVPPYLAELYKDTGSRLWPSDSSVWSLLPPEAIAGEDVRRHWRWLGSALGAWAKVEHPVRTKAWPSLALKCEEQHKIKSSPVLELRPEWGIRPHTRLVKCFHFPHKLTIHLWNWYTTKEIQSIMLS